MNTFNVTNRTAARVLAFVTVFAMVASIFAAPFSVALAVSDEVVPLIDIPQQEEVFGCTDDASPDFTPLATVDDQSCTYPIVCGEGEQACEDTPDDSYDVTIEVCKYTPEEVAVEGWPVFLLNGTDDGQYELSTGEDGCVSQVVDATEGPWYAGEENVPGWSYVSHSAYNGNNDVLEVEGDEEIPVCVFFDGEESENAGDSGEYSCSFVNVEDEPEDTDEPTTGECEIEGHKYDQAGNPLIDWAMGLMKIRTYEDESTESFDLATDTTDEDGYYCLEWDGQSGLPEVTEDTPSYNFVYRVYEVLKSGWTNVNVEKGADVDSLAAADDITTVADRVSVAVSEVNGYIYADAAYHVDFYNATTSDGDDGDDNGTSTGRYTLTVTMTGEGTGVVTSGDGLINCVSNNAESDCSETYPASTTVDLTATPDEGSNFDNSWTAGFGTCTGNATPCQVTMTQNVDLIAHFDTNSNGGGGGGGSRSSGTRTNHSSNDDDGDAPEGQVLGEQTSVVPQGAANAGGGGAAPVSAGLTLTPYFGATLTRFALRVK